VSTVTLPRELAESLLLLMTRTVTHGPESVPTGQWLVFANALDRAMHPRLDRAPETGTPPGTHRIASGTTQPFTEQESSSLRVCVVPGANGWPCEGCHVLTTNLRRRPPYLCATCYDEFVRDLAEQDQRPEHPGIGCNDACGHCGACT